MKNISRKEAKALKLKYYFTSKPCCNGHISKRYVSTAQCIQCKQSQYKGEKGRQKKAEVAKRYRESPKGRRYRMLEKARKRAKLKDLDCNIDLTDIVIPSKCPITGVTLALGDDGGLNLNSPSLDRVDNAKGYVKGNVRVISNKANRYKSDMSVSMIKKLAAYVDNQAG